MRMTKDKTFDWKRFLRMAIGIFLVGAGIVLVGQAGSNTLQILGGIAIAGIGFAILFND